MASTRVRQIGLACNLFALWVTAASAEQRLQNVAGSITLKRPAGEQLVIVEPEAGAPGARMGATGSDLVELTGQLLEDGRAASTVLEESHAALAKQQHHRFAQAGRQAPALGYRGQLLAARTRHEATRTRRGEAGILTGAAGCPRWAPWATAWAKWQAAG